VFNVNDIVSIDGGCYCFVVMDGSALEFVVSAIGRLLNDAIAKLKCSLDVRKFQVLNAILL